MPTGTIMAYSVPDGAQVLIDGIIIPGRSGVARTPTIIPEAPAGIRYVTFRLYGYIDDIKTVDVPQGGYASVYGVLHPIKSPS